MRRVMADALRGSCGWRAKFQKGKFGGRRLRPHTRCHVMQIPRSMVVSAAVRSVKEEEDSDCWLARKMRRTTTAW